MEEMEKSLDQIVEEFEEAMIHLKGWYEYYKDDIQTVADTDERKFATSIKMNIESINREIVMLKLAGTIFALNRAISVFKGGDSTDM